MLVSPVFIEKMPVTPTTTVNVRYMVADVEAAVAWYTKYLGFTMLSNAAPAFADVSLGSLRLLLSGPTSSAGRPMPDGARPGPGGWNRIHLIVDDLPTEVARSRTAGVKFRNDIVKNGGQELPKRSHPNYRRYCRRTHLESSPELNLKEHLCLVDHLNKHRCKPGQQRAEPIRS